MICKWCGASMDAHETVCRRCGKEAPPRSDCGGFYDLVPAARNIIPAAPVQPQVPQPVAAPAVAPAVEPAAKKSGLPLVLGLLCCVLAVVAVVAFASGNSAREEIAALEEKIEAMEEKEETVITLAQQDASVTLKLEHDEGIVRMKAEADPAGSAVVSCDPALLTGKVSAYSVKLTLPDGKKTAVTDIACNLGVPEMALQIACTLEAGFGESEEGFTLGGLWYTDSEGKEVQLKMPEETEVITASQAEGSATVTLSNEMLAQILEANELPKETVVICELVRENKDKGSFTIRVEGICITE